MKPSILWSAPVPPAAKHPHNMMLPTSHASELGWCSWACKPPPFSSKHNDGHYGQTVLFLFCSIFCFAKKYKHCPHVQLQTVVWLFLWRFWGNGFILAERPFTLCRYRTSFTVDIDTFVPVYSSIFIRSFAVVLGLICTFHAKVRASLGDRTCLLPWAVWWLRGPMVFILANYCLYRWTWYIQAFGNCSQDEPDLLRSTIFVEVLADFFWFSHDVKQRGTELEGRPWNTSTGTPPIDSNDVN